MPKSFWLNLQANYEAELLKINEEQTITEEERIAREDLKEMIPAGAFRLAANTAVNQNVLGAWIRLCQLAGNRKTLSTKFDKKDTDD